MKSWNLNDKLFKAFSRARLAHLQSTNDGNNGKKVNFEMVNIQTQ